MTVKHLEQTSPGRYKVVFENGEEIRSTLNVVTDLRIFSGKELDDTGYNTFINESSRALSRERALEVLSRRPMISKKELFDKLVRKGESEQAAADCVSWLSEKGFINEEEYAQAVARHYSAKGYGAGRVKTELIKRGVDRELWSDAFDAIPDSTDAIDKYLASHLTDPDNRDLVRKVSSALYRRGYSWDQIKSALNRFNACSEDY